MLRVIGSFIITALLLSLCSCAAPDTAGSDAPAQAAERIVSGYYISTSVCIALGLTDRLVGIEARAETRPIYELSAPELLELPNVGTARDFNLEACLALDPDLVLLPVRLQDIADTLEEMGVPVILLNPETHDGVLDMISAIGTATGADQRAEQLKSWYEGMLADIMLRRVAISYTPSVYIAGVGSWLTTAPRDMFQSSLVEAAGGHNVANDMPSSGWVDVSYEQLLFMNPEVIIIPSEADYDKEDILADAQLAALSAVETGRIYKMPSDYEAWDSPIPAAMLGAKWLLSVLHEGMDIADELQRDVEDFYREFYLIML